MILAQVSNPDGSISSGAGIAVVILCGIIALAIFAFIVAALVSIMQSKNLTGSGKFLWAVIIITFPLLGSLVWFVWGKTAQLTKPTEQEISQLNTLN